MRGEFTTSNDRGPSASRAHGGFTIIAALLASVTGCTPLPPTDGFYACSDGRCPADFPYCDPGDRRCYASPLPDSGPRPDTGPAPDAWAPAGTVGRFGVCATTASCVSGLECVEGYCLNRCTMGGSCPSGVCAPQRLRQPGFVCLDPCDGGAVCPDGTVRRVDSSRAVCHCVPATSNW